MVRVEVVAACPAHLEAVADAMRAADRAEILAAAGVGPAEALRRSLAASPLAWTGLADGRPACVFGVGAARPGEGRPWLLGTDLVERHAAAFLRRNRAYVERMQRTYPLLANHVDARNILSIRWLRWLGFTLGPAEPWGVARLPFHPFWRHAHV